MNILGCAKKPLRQSKHNSRLRCEQEWQSWNITTDKLELCTETWTGRFRIRIQESRRYCGEWRRWSLMGPADPQWWRLVANVDSMVDREQRCQWGPAQLSVVTITIDMHHDYFFLIFQCLIKYFGASQLTGAPFGSDDMFTVQPETGHTMMLKRRKPCIVVFLLI